MTVTCLRTLLPLLNSIEYTLFLSVQLGIHNTLIALQLILDISDQLLHFLFFALVLIVVHIDLVFLHLLLLSRLDHILVYSVS